MTTELTPERPSQADPQDQLGLADAGVRQSPADVLAEPTPEQIEAFKAAWHQADAEGRTGERVRDGLRAVLADLAPPQQKDVGRADAALIAAHELEGK